MLLYEHWPEGRKRTLLIAAAVILSRHLNTDTELIGGANYRLTELTKGAIKMARDIMKKIDSLYTA